MSTSCSDCGGVREVTHWIDDRRNLVCRTCRVIEHQWRPEPVVPRGTKRLMRAAARRKGIISAEPPVGHISRILYGYGVEPAGEGDADPELIADLSKPPTISGLDPLSYANWKATTYREPPPRTPQEWGELVDAAMQRQKDACGRYP